MTNLNLDKYLNIANEEKTKHGLESYAPLYPMLRVDNNKLYIGVMFTKTSDNVWDINEQIKPSYWMLIDSKNLSVIEFNKTEEKDFVKGALIPKDTINKQKDISKYTVEKTLQYENYLIEDIKNNSLPIQKKLASILNDEIEVDGNKVNINEYLISNLEEEIKEKVKELVNVLVYSKYGSLTFYYDNLFCQILNKYNNENVIDKEKIKLCIEIMNNYYDGVIGIDNFFNI